MLRVEAISKTYPTRSGELCVLRDINFQCDSGESAVIMGPSGSGKSTLLNILGALDAPSGGRVTVDRTCPHDLKGRDLARFRNQTIGFVFQDHHLMPYLSAIENILLPTAAFPPSSDEAHRELTGRAEQLLDRVGLSDRRDHLPAELSGGERQRVAIARAMIHQPQLLLADEPTGNLDRKTADHVGNLLAEVYAECDAVLVVVTHSDSLAERFDTVFDLTDGTIVERGAS